MVVKKEKVIENLKKKIKTQKTKLTELENSLKEVEGTKASYLTDDYAFNLIGEN